MDTSTLVVLGVIVVIAIVAVVLIASRSSRRPALKPLTAEAQDRYTTQWERVEAKFVDNPDEAVKEADALILALLGERQHPLAAERLPDRMRKARRLGTGREGRGGTEGMRQAMLQYRAVVEEYARPVERPQVTPEEGRREIAG
jgi:hypothetical protein